MSVVFSHSDVDICDLRWWSSTTIVPGGGQFQLPWSVQMAGQPIAFTCVASDGQPVAVTISLSGVEYIKQMQVGDSGIYTTANIPYLQANETLVIFGNATAASNLTFSILIKHNSPTR